MHFIETCSIKINLNLRVLRRRDDGYHEIHSLFWRRKSPEVLEITAGARQDTLQVAGASIPGENLLIKVCSFLRTRFGSEALPPLEMRLSKFLPMGSGIGAGSGNAAALLRWFARSGGCALPELSEMGRLGADVAFLASRYDLALADGIGEELEGLDETLDLPGVILFPTWSSDTREAYARIDHMRETQTERPVVVSREEARRESRDILKRLKGRKFLGFLPNDFMLCHADHLLCYNDAYSIFEESGALAWGLCGSGSSCFALFASRTNLADALSSRLERFPWLQKIMVME